MIIKTRTNVYQTSYHLIFVSNYRQNVFETAKRQEDLKSFFEKVADKQEIEILSQKVMQDHVRLLVSFPPHYSISDVVKKLKGSAARYWFLKYPETKQKLWKGHLWAPSYFVGTTGNISTNIVSEYIKNQKDQPPKS